MANAILPPNLRQAGSTSGPSSFSSLNSPALSSPMRASMQLSPFSPLPAAPGFSKSHSDLLPLPLSRAGSNGYGPMEGGLSTIRGHQVSTVDALTRTSSSSTSGLSLPGAFPGDASPLSQLGLPGGPSLRSGGRSSSLMGGHVGVSGGGGKGGSGSGASPRLLPSIKTGGVKDALLTAKAAASPTQGRMARPRPLPLLLKTDSGAGGGGGGGGGGAKKKRTQHALLTLLTTLLFFTLLSTTTNVSLFCS